MALRQEYDETCHYLNDVVYSVKLCGQFTRFMQNSAATNREASKSHFMCIIHTI